MLMALEQNIVSSQVLLVSMPCKAAVIQRYHTP